ncbi:Cys-tRNA(Pro) deacylase [Neobacillus kokaensis]|uniref:Cys-tRNA(Pro)/Cys-tRNA(Cys) deacylase n=1 Tax=Neobacillus kokaensis TaxID=2759023 RepID=A0ABQ3N360_9BACI|nr:Cys-tRNA(Pro) deacylase [Neobacillus kokaensis]GHH98007.1 Cys-tRNA(Pro)/Cys-tRNA(Cys) deacylase [Neobacillus kokaensis]
MAQTKTNAMRILDTHKIPYEILTYDNKDGKIDGVSVAEKIGREPKEVFKTLVAQGASKNVYVFVIPVEGELDMKKAAKAAGEKNMEMVPVKDIQKWTGYIRGGCSPVGMKKHYQTFIDESCLALQLMVVSAGKIGMQIVISPGQLKEVTAADITAVTK